MWIEKEEQKIFDIGWLIGFFTGEGTACLGRQIGRQNRSRKTINPIFVISFAQKEIYPLLKVKEILVSLGCNEKDIIIRNSSKKTTNELRLKYSAMPIFITLMRGTPFYSEKREIEFKIFLEEWDAYQLRKAIKESIILNKKQD